MIALGLFVLGAVAGSFVSALTWRLRKNKNWITGRSQCPHCGHNLSPFDLVPIFSWLALRGRCRYCHRKISAEYPLIELFLAVSFAGSYLFWPIALAQPGQKLLLAGWLLVSVGLGALALYDYRWRILPNKIIYPTLVVAALTRLIYITNYVPDQAHAVKAWLAAVAVASGFFWLVYQLSKGRWIGLGDVRLGLITGTALADYKQAILMVFLASALGTLTALPIIASGRLELKAKIAYGPFLIVATLLSLLFGNSLINWYTGLYR